MTSPTILSSLFEGEMDTSTKTWELFNFRTKREKEEKNHIGAREGGTKMGAGMM